jgi:DNA (cytosine-5)-methyltransferase 1
MKALDLFAGHGWGVAAHALGITEYGVEIMKEAVETRDLNGMTTVYQDVWDGLIQGRRIEHDVLIASPPCQTFSRAGSGSGRKALDQVLEAIAKHEYCWPQQLKSLGDRTDPRTALVLTPLAHIWRDHPMYVALEQVPYVQVIWEAYAELMREWGYSVWVGILNAEQYGVPQCRRRAILIARRDGKEALPPAPTHSKYYPRDPKRLDPGVEKWISMADALGWEQEDLVGFPRKDDGLAESIELDGEVYRKRDLFPASGPAQNVGSKVRSWKRFPQVWFERPATTVAGDNRIAGPGRSEFVKGGVSRQDRPGTVRVSLEEALVLQSYPRDFQMSGTPTRRFLQVGNAVPPRLAEAILKEFLP